MPRKKKYSNPKEAQAVWRANNKEHIREYAREYDKKRRATDEEFRERRNKHSSKSNKKRAEDIKAKHRLKNYGVTPEKYKQLLKECAGVCLICEKEDKTDLSIDHNHKTGQVRGLLCRSCNLMVGNLEKYAPLIGKMLDYCGLKL